MTNYYLTFYDNDDKVVAIRSYQNASTRIDDYMDYVFTVDSRIGGMYYKYMRFSEGETVVGEKLNNWIAYTIHMFVLAILYVIIALLIIEDKSSFIYFLFGVMYGMVWVLSTPYLVELYSKCYFKLAKLCSLKR